MDPLNTYFIPSRGKMLDTETGRIHLHRCHDLHHSSSKESGEVLWVERILTRTAVGVPISVPQTAAWRT